jgi:hypothetical protein
MAFIIRINFSLTTIDRAVDYTVLFEFQSIKMAVVRIVCLAVGMLANIDELLGAIHVKFG